MCFTCTASSTCRSTFPRWLARAAMPVVATLHDYTLVCPSGGQRIHRADQHVCEEIDTERCARCFGESPFSDQISLGRFAGATAAPELLGRVALTVRRRYPALAGGLQRLRKAAGRQSVTPSEIEGRLAAARRVFDDVDLFVAPSRFMASEFERFGIAAAKIKVSDYGFAPQRERASIAATRAAAAGVRRHARVAQGRARPDRRGPGAAGGRGRTADIRRPRRVSRLHQRSASARSRLADPLRRRRSIGDDVDAAYARNRRPRRAVALARELTARHSRSIHGWHSGRRARASAASSISSVTAKTGCSTNRRRRWHWRTHFEVWSSSPNVLSELSAHVRTAPTGEIDRGRRARMDGDVCRTGRAPFA